MVHVKESSCSNGSECKKFWLQMQKCGDSEKFRKVQHWENVHKLFICKWSHEWWSADNKLTSMHNKCGSWHIWLIYSLSSSITVEQMKAYSNFKINPVKKQQGRCTFWRQQKVFARKGFYTKLSVCERGQTAIFCGCHESQIRRNALRKIIVTPLADVNECNGVYAIVLS